VRKNLFLPGVLLSLLVLLPVVLAAQDKPEAEPVIRTSVPARVQLQGREASISATLGYRGPLFSLPTLSGMLGGKLVIGPLQKAHTLTIGDTKVIIGPDSSVMTIGQEIIELSQTPLVSTAGLEVPLDFLRRTFGEMMGYNFDWREGERLLVIDRLSGEELPIEIDWLHSQGTTTLVLAFPRRPRYNIDYSGSPVTFEMIGDRLRTDRLPTEIDDPLIRRIRVSERGVEIDIIDAAAAAAPYENDRGSRYEVVLDIARGPRRTQTTSSAPADSFDASQEPSQLLPRPGRRAGGPMRIVVDPGHGGPESGAVGSGGTLEKDLTLLLARALKRRLETRLSASVILTRTSDEDLPHEARTAIANENQADLFISLHLNSEPWASGARGAETYFLSKKASDERAANAAQFENRGAEDSALQLMLWDLAQNRHMARSQQLAKQIQQELNETLDLRDRGVKQAPFRVLVGATMPAVLVELGFLSNPAEEAKLVDPAYRQKLIESLTAAIVRFRSGGE
jgi:N-acetylmuramoyl-L-alanine amidase